MLQVLFAALPLGTALLDRVYYNNDRGYDSLPLVNEAIGGLARAAELAHREWTAGASRLLGSIDLDLLAPDLARARLETAHDIARRLGSRTWTRWTAAPLAVVRARLGEVSSALELLDFADRLAGAGNVAVAAGGSIATSPTLGQRHLALARAEIALLDDRPADALALADARLAAERASEPYSALGVPRLSLVRAQALVGLGRLDDAAGALEQARAEATAQGGRPLLWRVEAAVGHLHRARRERLEARKAFDAARAIADDLASRVPDEQLRARFLEGVDRIVPGVPAPSPAKAAKEAFGGLTRRERDVAELVAQGKANRAIARELGIGERTVEGYVASALGRLGFTSRTQLAAWAVEQGLGRHKEPRSTR